MVSRLSRMGWLELFNIGWLALVFFWFLDIPATAANVTGYAVAGALLLQGGVY